MPGCVCMSARSSFVGPLKNIAKKTTTFRFLYRVVAVLCSPHSIQNNIDVPPLANPPHSVSHTIQRLSASLNLSPQCKFYSQCSHCWRFRFAVTSIVHRDYTAGAPNPPVNYHNNEEIHPESESVFLLLDGSQNIIVSFKESSIVPISCQEPISPAQPSPHTLELFLLSAAAALIIEIE